MRNFSAYDAVELLLLHLEFILLDYDRSFGKSRVRTMYDKLSLMKSSLIDKKLTSSLESRIADTVDSAQRQIASGLCSLMGLHIAEQAPTGIEGAGIEAGSSTVQNMLFRISNEDLPFVVYDAVVLLLHDLELSLSFYRHRFSDHSLSHLTADTQIMYDNLSMLDSLLIDSSGQGYDKKLMSGLENLICFVAYRGLGCIDRPRPRGSTRGPNIIRHVASLTSKNKLPDSILNPLRKTMEFIIEELGGIDDNREVIHKSTKELKRTSTGKFDYDHIESVIRT